MDGEEVDGAEVDGAETEAKPERTEANVRAGWRRL